MTYVAKSSPNRALKTRSLASMTKAVFLDGIKEKHYCNFLPEVKSWCSFEGICEPMTLGPRQANLCLRAFRHDKL